MDETAGPTASRVRTFSLSSQSKRTRFSPRADFRPALAACVGPRQKLFFLVLEPAWRAISFSLCFCPSVSVSLLRVGAALRRARRPYCAGQGRRPAGCGTRKDLELLPATEKRGASAASGRTGGRRLPLTHPALWAVAARTGGTAIWARFRPSSAPATDKNKATLRNAASGANSASQAPIFRRQSGGIVAANSLDQARR